jgi:hypothetical protein
MSLDSGIQSAKAEGRMLLMSSRLSAGLRRLLAIYTPALLGMQSTVWGDSHMLPSKGCKGLGGLPYTENRENVQSAFRLPSG